MIDDPAIRAHLARHGDLSIDIVHHL